KPPVGVRAALGFFNVSRLLRLEPRPYTYVGVCGTLGQPMVIRSSHRAGGISRNSALRRRWHPETKVIDEGEPEEEPLHGCGDKAEEVQRPPQKALGLRVKFL